MNEKQKFQIKMEIYDANQYIKSMEKLIKEASENIRKMQGNIRRLERMITIPQKMQYLGKSNFIEFFEFAQHIRSEWIGEPGKPGTHMVVTITNDDGEFEVKEGDWIEKYPDGECYKSLPAVSAFGPEPKSSLQKK